MRKNTSTLVQKIINQKCKKYHNVLMQKISILWQKKPKIKSQNENIKKEKSKI